MGPATFIIPTETAPSGGHAYNRSVLAAWPGTPPEAVSLPGPWPRGDRASLASLRSALSGPAVAIVDGLVGAAHPDQLAEAANRGCRIVLLVHLPLGDEGGLSEADRLDLDALEVRSLRVAWRVVATSRTAAAEIARRSGRDDIVAIPPGVSKAERAERHHPPGILQVGAIGPRKNQLASLAALAACLDLPWRATFVGPVADQDYAASFGQGLAAARATWTGPLTGAALEAAYLQADLLLHPATAETWGMVVTEALAHGIPAIVGAGTGAVEALGSGSTALPGAAVSLGDPDDLTRTLRRWLSDHSLRECWRDQAIQAREGLRGWPQASSELASTVER